MAICGLTSARANRILDKINYQTKKPWFKGMALSKKQTSLITID